MERELGRDYGIDIQAYPMGADWVFLVSGGEAHIGAVVVAYPELEAILLHTITMPGHREEQLAAEIAKFAASKLKRKVAVLMGIHIEHATKQEIAEIVGTVHRKMAQLLRESRFNFTL